MPRTYQPAAKVQRQCERQGCPNCFEGRSDKKYCSDECARAVQEAKNREAYEQLKASWNGGDPQPRTCKKCGAAFVPEKILQRYCGGCS